MHIFSCDLLLAGELMNVIYQQKTMRLGREKLKELSKKNCC